MTEADRSRLGKIIDIHSHFLPDNLPDFSTRYGYTGFVALDEGNDSNERNLKRGSKVLYKVPREFYDLNHRASMLIENGIEAQVLSPPSELFSYWAKADDTADLCRIYNNSVLKATEGFNDRFIPLFIVPLQAPELAVVEVQRCIELGFKGCCIGTSVNELNLSENDFVPFWEICEENNIVVFVHHNNVKVNRKDRKFELAKSVLPHTEITRSMCALVLSGIMEKFNSLKLVFFDGAGNYPWLSDRIDEHNVGNESLCKLGDLKKRILCDSLVGTEVNLDLIIEKFSDKNVMFGSNFPFQKRNDEKKAFNFENIIKSNKLSEEGRKNVLFNNVNKLLRLEKE